MKTMAEVLAEHGFRKWGDRLDDANWVVCLCGERVEGREKWQTLLAAHQAAALAAAGYGPVKEARAGALRDAAKSRDESKDLMRFTWGQRIWLRKRAAAIEAGQ